MSCYAFKVASFLDLYINEVRSEYDEGLDRNMILEGGGVV